MQSGGAQSGATSSKTQSGGIGKVKVELSGPDEEEQAQLAAQMRVRGLQVGLFDPYLVEPLEAKLFFDVPVVVGQRHMLRLRCEDSRSDLQRPCRETFASEHMGLYSGHGIALKEEPNGQEIRVLILETSEQRQVLLRVLERLQEEPSQFTKSKFGCIACGAKVSRRRRKKKISGGIPVAESVAEPESPFPAFEFEAWRTYVSEHWNEQCMKPTKSGTRGSLRDTNATNTGNFARKSSNRFQRVRSNGCAGTADMEAEAALLCRVLYSEADRMLCYPDSCISEFVADARGSNTGFDGFWDLCKEMSLVSHLMAESLPGGKLNKRVSTSDTFNIGPTMSLEAYQWFLVQMQNAEHATVEEACQLFKDMTSPEIDDSGAMTLVGLSHILCSPSNSILHPQRIGEQENGSLPLTDYWIGASQPHYACDGPADGEDIILDALQSHCRCLRLRLVPGTGDSVGPGISVLLRPMHRGVPPICKPFADVMRLLRERGFETSDSPLLLAFSLGSLPPGLQGGVPELLLAELGEILWHGGADGRLAGPPPSPDAARGRVIVLLEPFDVEAKTYQGDHFGCTLDMDVDRRDAPYEGLAIVKKEASEHWHEVMARFSVWPGQPFDCVGFAQRSPHEISFGFLASDDLEILEASKSQHLVEHHRDHISMVYPVEHPCAVVGYNVAAAWAVGVQLAPIHPHSEGVEVLVHAGRFAKTSGGSGYVMKPKRLRNSTVAQPAPKPLQLQLRIIAGRALPSASENGLLTGAADVVVSMWSSNGQTESSATSTAMPRAGPVRFWDEAIPGPTDQQRELQYLSFNVSEPDLAIVVFEVREQAGDGTFRRAAAFAAAADQIRAGLRWVPLWAATACAGAAKPTRYGALSGLLVEIIRN